jgi:DNA-binding response OmpR family regulator
MTEQATHISGKRVVLVISQEDERQALAHILQGMSLDVKDVSTGATALQLLEDYPVDLLIMDIKPADMHGWQLLSKVNEIADLRQLPIIVITDRGNVQFAGKPIILLLRPLSIAKLKQNVLETLDN